MDMLVILGDSHKAIRRLEASLPMRYRRRLLRRLSMVGAHLHDPRPEKVNRSGQTNPIPRGRLLPPADLGLLCPPIIIDSHVYCFPPVDSRARFASAAEHCVRLVTQVSQVAVS